MSQGKRYEVAGLVFPTQSSLEAEIHRRLFSQPLNQEFEDQFMATVINTYHQEVIAAGQHTTGLFRFLDFREQTRRGLDSATRHRGGKLLMSFFDPLGDWRDCTAYPWRGQRNPRRDIKNALREKINEYLPRPKSTDRCARQPCTATGSALEYQHIDPTFNEIAEACMELMTEAEIETRFGYSKFKTGFGDVCDLLPPLHPAVKRLIDLHIFNDWEWLCAYHHRGVTAAHPVVLQPVLWQ